MDRMSYEELGGIFLFMPLIHFFLGAPQPPAMPGAAPLRQDFRSLCQGDALLHQKFRSQGQIHLV